MFPLGIMRDCDHTFDVVPLTYTFLEVQGLVGPYTYASASHICETLQEIGNCNRPSIPRDFTEILRMFRVGWRYVNPSSSQIITETRACDLSE